MIGYLFAGFLAVLLLTNGITWHYTSKAAAVKIAVIEAAGRDKEKRNARLQAETLADAEVTAAAAKAARLDAARAALERDKALRDMGGVVRSLADAQRVLGGASGSGQPAYTGTVVRSDQGDPRADTARRLEACYQDLTVLTDTLSFNKFNHEQALIARDACVKQYNDVRSKYNERTP